MTTDKPTILVAGAGTMGNSIAQVFAASGYSTYMASRHQETLDSAVERISAAVKVLKAEGMAGEEYETRLQENLHLVRTDDVPSIAQSIDVVFETIVENPDSKRDL